MDPTNASAAPGQGAAAQDSAHSPGQCSSRLEWVEHGWARTQKGNWTRVVAPGIRVTVFRWRNGDYRFAVMTGQLMIFGREDFATFDQAALSALDLLQAGG